MLGAGSCRIVVAATPKYRPIGVVTAEVDILDLDYKRVVDRVDYNLILDFFSVETMKNVDEETRQRLKDVTMKTLKSRLIDEESTEGTLTPAKLSVRKGMMTQAVEFAKEEVKRYRQDDGMDTDAS